MQKCEVQPFVFPRVPIWQRLLTISFGDLNINLGAWNGFSANCRESCDRLFFLNYNFLKYGFWSVTWLRCLMEVMMINCSRSIYHQKCLWKLQLLNFCSWSDHDFLNLRESNGQSTFKRIQKFEKPNDPLRKAELDLEFLLRCRDSEMNVTLWSSTQSWAGFRIFITV